MRPQATSGFIFDLVTEFELLSASEQPNVFTDEAYENLCSKYISLAAERDRALYHYLLSTPNLFRTHLPHSKYAIAVARNVVWYYDEIILNDPVLQLINNDNSDLETKKHNLRDVLVILMRYRESIEHGFLLLSGNQLTPDKTGSFEAESEELIQMPEVLDSFERFTQLIKKPSPTHQEMMQIEVMYDGLWGWMRSMAMHIPEGVTPKAVEGGIMYDFTTPYKRMSKEELISFGKGNMLESLKREYRKDINVILETIANAQRLNTPVLFYRQVDTITAQHYAKLSQHTRTVQLANTSVYDCVVPYLDGIPAERLFETRAKIPAEFQEFRAFLYDLVLRTMQRTDNSAEIKFHIDSEINSLLRKLDVEMANIKRRWVAKGIASPLAQAAASITLMSSGIDFIQMLSAFVGGSGVAKGIEEWSDRTAAKRDQTLNPVYFLWKALEK